MALGTETGFDYGVAWYPEWCWDGRWREELDEIQHAGFNAVRIGEFAWDTLEPQPGLFRFSLYDDVMKELEDRRLACVLGVDTVRPPAWVFQQYPDIHLVDDRGNRAPGTWPAHCFNHPAFKELSARYIAAFVERYRSSPVLRMYQLDNEPAYHYHNVARLADSWFCYCQACQEGFANWLDEHYGASDRRPALTAPFPAPHEMGELAWMEWRLFHDATNVRRIEWVKAEVHRIDPSHPITTNVMLSTGFAPDSSKLAHDVVRLSAELDVMGMDFYPRIGATNTDRDALVFSLADQLGGADGFQCLETQVTTYDTPGGHWVDQETGFTAMAPPTTIIPQFWRAVAYGAKSLYYWAWRLDADNVWALARPDGSTRDVVKTTAALSQEINRLWSVLQDGRRKAAPAAVLFNRASVHLATRHGLAEVPGATVENAVACTRHYCDAVDVFDTSFKVPELSGYRLVVAPFLYIVDSALEKALTDYVENGGTLLWGARSGSYAEPDNGWREVPVASRLRLPSFGAPPRSLQRVLGYCRTESLLAATGDECVLGTGAVIPAGRWVEEVRLAPGCEVLGHMSMTGNPGLVRNRYGSGTAWSSLIDAFSSPSAGLLALVGGILGADGRPGEASAGPGREIIRRSLPTGELLFAINSSSEPWPLQVALETGETAEELLQGSPMPCRSADAGQVASLEVPPLNAAIVRLIRKLQAS